MSTEIFISATTHDLGSYRLSLRDKFLDAGFHPIVQDHFQKTSDVIRGMIREKIEACHAVVCLVGEVFGEAPPTLPDRSYTQLEYDYARELGKPVFLYVSAEEYASDADPTKHHNQNRKTRGLQNRYRNEFLAGEVPYTLFKSWSDIDESLIKLIAGFYNLEKDARSSLPSSAAEEAPFIETEFRRTDFTWLVGYNVSFR